MPSRFVSGFVLAPARLGIAAACAIALGVCVAAQVPVFRAAASLVHLEVRVLDKDRRPVRGLKAADFTVLEDGRAQSVIAFSAIDVADPEQPTAKWMRTIASDVRTNERIESPESRLWVVLLDDAMIPFDPAAIQSAKAIARSVLDGISPLDQVAIVFSAGSRGTQNFTSDRARLLAAIETLNAGYSDYSLGWRNAAQAAGPSVLYPGGLWNPTADPDIPMKQSALQTLASVAESLIAAPQRRKSLVYISPGIAVDPESASAPILLQGGRNSQSMLSAESNKEMFRKLPELFRRMQNANVTIYSYDPCGLSGLENYIVGSARGMRALSSGGGPLPAGYNWLAPGASSPAPRPEDLAHHLSTLTLDFLQTAAQNTGGKAVVHTNDFQPGLDAMFRENASYYIVGYATPPGNKPGSLHRLAVKVNRPDVTVIARTGYEMPKDEKPAMTADSLASKSLTTSINGPTASGGVPLRVALAPVAVPERADAAVTMVLGFDEPPVTSRTLRRAEVRIEVFTPDGRSIGRPIPQSANFTQLPRTDGATFDLFTQLSLPPGRYEVRVGLRRPDDNITGSVYADLDVPDFAKAALSLSGLMVETEPVGATIGSDVFATLVPVTPTTRRTFSKADKVNVFFRVYQGGAEPVSPVSVSVTLVNEHDVVLAAPKGEIPSTRFGQARAADHRFVIPVGMLAPGEYLVTFDVTRSTTTVSRSLRFRVR